MEANRMTWVEHLSELRWRLIVAFAFFALASGVAFAYAHPLLSFLIEPALRHLDKLVFTSPAEAFVTYIKLGLVSGFIVSLPVFLYQFAAFAWPGLHRREKLWLVLVLPLSLLFFAAGLVFGYTIVIPRALYFFLQFSTGQVQALITLGSYVSLVLMLTIPFGIFFQLPIVLGLLGGLGWVRPQWLRRYRGIALVIDFLVSAIVTPPDLFSQVALALPLYLLYELSILVVSYTYRQHEEG